MAPPNSEPRWPGLDVLRAVAVLLVICRHFENYASEGSALYWFLKATSWVGWAGVDLFFALSGFLISNLLFQEHREFGKIQWKTFLMRRAFKIYPGFYALIAMSVIGLVEPQGWATPASLAGELFFLQNYLDSLWLHTWSLAVEEHFYFLMTMLFVVPWHESVVKRWPTVVGTIAFGCLATRVITGTYIPFYYDTHLQQTHVRIDGLFFGSLAGYLFNFHGTSVLNMIARRRSAYNLVTAGAIAIPFAARLEDSFFEQTFGLTILSIGFSMLTLGSVAGAFEIRPGKAREALVNIGRCSYAIYLWHYPIAWRFLPEVQSYVPFRIKAWIAFLLYVSASVCFGIVMTRWVEAPSLRLRDRLFPRRTVTLREESLLVPT